ncbi:MAG: bifunctional UDP-N-acetylglucosamine diphosphorylase/glucosamine-1-phosphate N-acetyltransferase GlmU [Burkholderiales bacterium]
MNVVILAAGKGTRMYSRVPKVLHRLAGIPLLSHVINTARLLKPAGICVVYGHGGEAVPAAFSDGDLRFALQEPQNGTGHAVQMALPHLVEDGNTLILYGDVPLTGIATLEKLTQTEGMALLTAQMGNPHGYGRIVRDDDGSIVRIVEEKDATKEEREITEVNTGILVAPTKKLKSWLSGLKNDNAQKEYYLTDVIEMAASEGTRITSVHPQRSWEVMGVNNKAQLAELERIFQLETARELMMQGVGLADPARLDVRGELSCGMDVFIDANCVFEGVVRLGDNVRIGANSVLKNVEIREGTEIAPFTHIEGAGIGRNCKIGPYARIRPGTTLADDAHIGNFVEIKNSRIGAGSKANHLSYVGDASVGNNVNIGAGTITCNYDGANKHRTVIEDDAFIGSDTQLIAPVTVGKGATIGAGSTITRNAPEGGLTLSRSRQVHIESWKRPKKG